MLTSLMIVPHSHPFESAVMRLRTLGALDLIDPGGSELRAVLAQPKRAALLAYLAITARRGPQRRDSLLALFWPELDEDHARRALSQAVHFLRRSLASEVVVSRADSDLTIDRERMWCDATAFEEALAAGRPREALDLYRGDLLDGFHIAGAPDFQRWLDVERARLGARYAHAIEAVAEDRERSGDFRGAVADWRRLAARDPLNSRVALRLMQALARAGDPGGAVQHARVHEILLREEMNVPPDPAVVALVQQLQAAPAQQEIVGGVVPTAPRAPSAAAPVEVSSASATPASLPTPAVHRPRWALIAALLLIVALGGILIARSRAESARNRALVNELLARGRNAEQNRSLTGIETAKRHYWLAIELRPDHAPAYAALSLSYQMTAQYGYAPARPALDSARLMATRALARDANLADAHTALAVSLGDGGDFDGADRAFRRAIQLEPKNAYAHYWYAVFLVALGRPREARHQIEAAAGINTLLPRGVLAVQRAVAYLETGSRPVSRWDSIIKLEPGEPWARRGVALDFAHNRKCPEARAQIDTAQRHAVGAVPLLFAVPIIERLCGDQQRAAELMEHLKRLPRAHDDGAWIAMAHARFGEMDSAFAWLDRQVWTTPELMDLRAIRWFDELRVDPRYGQLLYSLGLRTP